MPKKPKPSPSVLTERVELRMSAKEKRTFQEAAKRQGIGLSQWLRLAAHKIINEHQGKVTLIDLER